MSLLRPLVLHDIPRVGVGVSMAAIVFAAPTRLAFCGRQGHMLGDVCGKEGRGSHSWAGEAGCLRSLGPADDVRSCVRWSNKGP